MADDKKEIPKLLLQTEAMKFLRCSASTLKRLRLAGELDFISGRPVLVLEDSVHAYVERNTHRSKYHEKLPPGSAEALRADDEKVIALARRDALKRRLRKTMKDF